MNSKCEKAEMFSTVAMSIFFHWFPLDFKNMKSCRQVSNVWYQISLQRWREISVVKLSVDSSITPHCYRQNPSSSSDVLKLSHFLNIIRYSENFYRARSFRIENVQLSCAIDLWRSSEIRTFWSNFGPWLKHLHLKLIQIPSCHIFLRIVCNLTINLESLIIENCDVTFLREHPNTAAPTSDPIQTNKHLKNLQISPLYEQSTNISWLSLLEYFPKLESAKLHGFNPQVATKELTRFLQTIGKLQYFQNKESSLRHLDIMNMNDRTMVLDSHTVELMCQIGLHLESLCVDIGCPSSPEVLINILESQYKTLKSLTIRTWMKIPFHNFPYHVIPPGLTSFISYGVLFDVKFLEFTPNLRRMSVWNFPKFLDIVDIEWVSKERLGQMIEFHYQMDKPCSKKVLAGVRRLMPNLKYFWLHMPMHSFKV